MVETLPSRSPDVARLHDGKFQFRLRIDKFNGPTFFGFMKGLYQTSITSGRRVVVITDNAKYHHARLHRQWREEDAAEFVPDYCNRFTIAFLLSGKHSLERSQPGQERL